MRAVVQRVSSARVEVEGERVGAIDAGLLVLLSAGGDDTDADVATAVDKIAGLRIFSDEAGKMNLDVGQIGGAVLLVSQFTLHGDVRKGRRPSFVAAMEPVRAAEMVQQVAEGLAVRGLPVEQGRFGADMQVTLCNDGPVTILIDTKRSF
ncbi:MAG: hypothetical protein RIT45_234 [Pseudomonadota bacterium]|jgi:D-tyrosyl-tRNA(Tyr) deacylase